MKFKGYLLDDTVRSVYGLAVADINGDGRIDIIAGSTGESIIAWYEAPGWKRHLVTDHGSGHITIAPYDLTGNGTPDLIVGSGFNRGVNAAGGYLHWLEAPAEDGQNWRELPYRRGPLYSPRRPRESFWKHFNSSTLPYRRLYPR